MGQLIFWRGFTASKLRKRKLLDCFRVSIVKPEITAAVSGQENAGGKAAFPVSRKRKLSTSAAELQAERDGLLPVWIRSPKSGPEHYVGFSRAKLYQLAGEGKIRSVSIRAPGQVKGVRLFHLGSILDFVARCEASANAKETGDKDGELDAALAKLVRELK